jgi:hypothetical protein
LFLASEKQQIKLKNHPAKTNTAPGPTVENKYGIDGIIAARTQCVVLPKTALHLGKLI